MCLSFPKRFLPPRSHTQIEESQSACQSAATEPPDRTQTGGGAPLDPVTLRAGSQRGRKLPLGPLVGRNRSQTPENYSETQNTEKPCNSCGIIRIGHTRGKEPKRLRLLCVCERAGGRAEDPSDELRRGAALICVLQGDCGPEEGHEKRAGSDPLHPSDRRCLQTLVQKKDKDDRSL